jgi:phosphohistidine phosphatase
VKTLLLMRHADADPADGALSDHQRPLSRYGRSSGMQIGSHLSRGSGSGGAPRLILCSPARRNLETAELLRARLPDPPRLVVQQDLYLADRGTMLSLLHQLDPSEQQVLVLGHNPGTAMLASWLCGAGESAEVGMFSNCCS